MSSTLLKWFGHISSRNNDPNISEGILSIISEERTNINRKSSENCVQRVKEFENTRRNYFVNDLIIDLNSEERDSSNIDDDKNDE